VLEDSELLGAALVSAVIFGVTSLRGVLSALDAWSDAGTTTMRGSVLCWMPGPSLESESVFVCGGESCIGVGTVVGGVVLESRSK